MIMLVKQYNLEVNSSLDMMDQKQTPEIDLVSIGQLVNAAKAGDSAAHSEICRQVQGRLTRLADKQLDQNLRRKINPSDIVQATLTRMVGKFDDFRGSTSAEFYGWLNAILKNEVNTTRRDLRRQRRDIRREQDVDGEAIGVQTDQDTPCETAEKNETLLRFHQVIDRLPADYSQVIKLRGILELPFTEVAEQMQRSVDSVSKLWARALVKLQQELSKIDSPPK